jgi:D-3-phosphoglycerate dehydrogenase
VPELAKIIGEYDALVVRSATKVTADALAAATRMKVIGRAGTGVDNIDVPAATRRGILVMNTPGGNTVSAAEHTISLMLALARNIPQAHMSMTRGEWERKKFVGTEVFEKTAGVIGLGKIGREVALRCQGLGMKVLGYDPVLSTEATQKLGIEPVSLDEIFRRSDFISVHTPLSPETRGLLNAKTLALCKKGVRIVNCARGGIVDEAALLDALESGHVGGAALDVYEKEPPAGNALIGHPRVVVTPHLGASTEEAQEKVAIQIAHQLADALHGRAYGGVVNSAALHLMLNAEARPYLELAEHLGSFIAQVSPGKLRKLTIGTAGDLANQSAEVLRAGVLKGILAVTQPDPVNIISAPFLAQELGIAVTEERDAEAEVYGNLLRVKYETDGGVREAAGAVLGTAAGRLVMLDGFRFEVVPEGLLLVYNNVDRPGMLAQVGAVLSKNSVNIGGVALGRHKVGGDALTIMNVDGDMPDAALTELGLLAGIRDVHLARL